VVPCHDEEGNVRRYREALLPALEALGRSFEVVLVDDGSRDGTAAAAAELAAADPRVRAVTLSPNRGLGGALRAGFAECGGTWIATLDADLTFRPAALKDLLAEADKGADLVAGSPYLRRGDLDVPWARALPSLMLNALYRGLFGMSLTAYTPVFRVYRAAKLLRLRPTAAGFEINAELAARAQLAGWTVAEVPARLDTRVAGVSKLRRWRELSRHAALIARLLAGR
jgi:glycosyltransferase involved in cell wall biosynthesis